MTFTISPELEQRIVANAQQSGVSVDEYASELLVRSLPPKPVFLGEGVMYTGDQLREAMSKVATEIPNGVDELFPRALIHEDSE